MPKTSRVVGVLVALVTGSAIGCSLVKDLGNLDTEGTDDDSGGDTGGTMSDGDADAGSISMTSAGDADSGSGDDGGAPVMPSSDVDILFVVDNSGFMGEEQGRLAATFHELTEPLQQAGIRYRIAVTTTDSGNPWCNGTSPEGGHFVMSSCQTRLNDFLFMGNPQVDATQAGCLDVCGLPSFELAPTPTQLDPTPTPRPWVEWNAPEDFNTPGLAPSQVLSCALPTGINGCGFEQPLESMRSALQIVTQPSEAEYGFVRPDANLIVVFVTDELDCSVNPDHEDIFLPDGDRTFWSNPDEGAPTSAVCWNAGVQCTGMSPYDTCEPVDLAPDGFLAASDAEASLYPVARYTEFLAGLQATKTAGRVRVMAFVGRASNGEFVYQDGIDPAFENDFGIAPGCSSPGGPAVPPVRIRAVANAVNDVPDDGLVSICEGDYAPALGAMADAIIGWSQ